MHCRFPFIQYVALYDYDPTKSSPNPNPTLEVSFQEGDLIKVFDTTRSDGFYGAEVSIITEESTFYVLLA